MRTYIFNALAHYKCSSIVNIYLVFPTEKMWKKQDNKNNKIINYTIS